MQHIRPISRALLSVSDKTGLVELARALSKRGVSLISTGGTSKALREAGLKVEDVSAITGFPEIMDGRVKTLHPKVHGGLLARRAHPEHQAAMLAHGIESIDLLIINLYPFEETIAKGADFETSIENIDIGGPAMLRGAAKNHDDVAVVTDPADYQTLLDELEALGGTSLTFRKRLAAKAYARTAAYDGAIATWFAAQIAPEAPDFYALSASHGEKLRYGENPHQDAMIYRKKGVFYGVATAQQLQGKALSYNNYNDTDAAFELVSEFDPKIAPAIAIIKHANPCGVATGKTMLDAWQRALSCDPTSAFGGIVALNQPLDAATAKAISEIFTEVIIAPEASAEAQAILAKKKNLRLLVTGGLANPRARGETIRSITGGYLVQGRDAISVDDLDLQVVTKRQPTEAEWLDLKCAFRIAKHVKSNAIIYVKDGASVGIGAGQMSRVDSARIAAVKAEDAAKAMGLKTPLTKGSVVASDAFFPFADGLEVAIAAGATAVIQPGGSMRDDEVIAAADKAGIAMVLTGVRHFRH